MNDLQILNADQLDFQSFNGFQEKLYITKKQAYSQAIGDESWGQFLSCTYFASAFLKPGASTGLHRHDRICIVTVVTHGVLTHDDGNNGRIELQSGQTLIQCAGDAGFEHNETNTTSAFTGIIQIWFDNKAWHSAPAFQHEVVLEGKQSELIGHKSAFEGVDIVFENHYRSKLKSLLTQSPALVFCYQGSITIERENNLDATVLKPGCMAISDVALKISLSEDCSFLIISKRQSA